MTIRFLACTFFIVASIEAFTQTDPSVSGGERYLTALLDRTVIFDTTKSIASVLEQQVAPEYEWKNWQIVENFTYGKDRGSLPMIADLKSLHPFFREKINELIKICKSQGIELAIVESFRTHAKQAEYFGMGREYTRSKGGKSKHQYGLAVDVVPIIDSAAVWDNTALWKKIGLAGEKLGLHWGGRWRSPYDPAHFEWTGGLTTRQLASGVQPSISETITNHYPCIDEELQLLQKYWEAWEVEQSMSARNSEKGSQNQSSGVGQKP